MANDTPTKTTLRKGDNLPARGRSVKTIILEAIRENSHLNLTPKSTKDEAEKAFFNHVARSAFNLEDSNRGTCLTLLSNKGWPNLKPSNETVNFHFEPDSLPHIQAAQVLKAVADGDLQPDIGNTFIQSIKAMIDIEEYTNLKERIEKLEKALAGES